MIIKFSIYIAGGIVTSTLSMVYFIAIVRTKINRKRYGLLGMEFFADGLMAFAITLAGATRIVQIFLVNHNGTVPRLFCVIMPHNVILAWTEPMTAISTLVVSIDQIISVVKPVLYYKNMAKIQHYLVVGSNLSVLLLIFASVVCSYLNNASVHSFCWVSDSRCPLFNQIFYATRIIAAAGTVVLYIIILIIVRRHYKKINEQQNLESIQISKRQLHFTTTVGILCFTTVVLQILPMIMLLLKIRSQIILDSIYLTVALITFLNFFSKTIIIGCRSSEIRQAIIDLMPGLFRRFGIERTQTVNVVDFKVRHAVNITVKTRQ